MGLALHIAKGLHPMVGRKMARWWKCKRGWLGSLALDAAAGPVSQGGQQDGTGMEGA